MALGLMLLGGLTGTIAAAITLFSGAGFLMALGMYSLTGSATALGMAAVLHVAALIRSASERPPLLITHYATA
ncbi:hypothetical protein [Heliomarina baculiformis]|uniref:hypothetical protein n=1 Tax=Heliomarina baculiformis TaxID=2872036 RepID=UPI001EE3937D|nr:hypothetical protein [Heliomarina baculiformis]